MSDYKLILAVDNSNKTEVRYRRSNDSHWQTLYLNEVKPDDVIDAIFKALANESLIK